ncbi:MAG: YciI family protein [Paracoccaceae bacterium]
MPNFVFAYHGGKMPETPEEGAKEMAKWEAWMGKHSAAFVDQGAPVGKSSTVSAAGVADNGGANPISGVSTVKADTLAAALEIAKGCPIVANGGSVEVAQVMEM